MAKPLLFLISFVLAAAALIEGGEVNPLHGIKINYRYSSRSDLDYVVETNCTSSCADLADGVYDSCKSCFHFTLCHKEEIQNIFECADNLFWDDVQKDCVNSTSTCSMYEVGNITATEEPSVNYTMEALTTTETAKITTTEEPAVNYTMEALTTTEAANITATTEEPDTATTDEPDNSVCISSCKGMAAGNYQSCHGCSVYATCANGVLYDHRPCPAGLVWDDSYKLCNYVSSTCHEEVDVPEVIEPEFEATPAPAPATTVPTRAADDHSCIRSCKGVPDGDYHSCLGCGHYATCLLGVFITRKCTLKNTMWDDEYKMCLSRSQTCKPSRICVENNCSGVPDGDYHSCHGCAEYSTCLMGVFIDRRQCLKGTVWDNKYKICLTSSNTCEDDSKFHPDPSHPLVTDEPTSKPETTTSNPENCISSCKNMADGNYQSCKGCNVFASCSGGRLIDSRPCAANLVWDDMVKQCIYKSSTCQV